MKKKYKNKIIIALIALALMSVYIFITTWQAKTYEEVHTMYPLSKSKNPKASEEFLKAMEYRIYIKELHPFFDYDSFVMAPLLMKLNYHFKRGKALLPKDSVEDIVWWTLFYKEIYGLLVPPRNDNSMAYENMPPKEFAKVHDAVYRMIIRYPEGEVYFDIPEIKAFRFQVMAILVEFFYKKYSSRYKGTFIEKAKQNDLSVASIKKLNIVKEKYKITYKNFINSSKDKPFMERYYFADQIYIISDLVVKYVRIHNTQILPFEMCYSQDMQFILKHTNKLMNFVETHDSIQVNTINILLINPNYSNVPVVFKLLNYRCPNLRPEITQIVQKVEQLNKQLNKKDK